MCEYEREKIILKNFFFLSHSNLNFFVRLSCNVVTSSLEMKVPLCVFKSICLFVYFLVCMFLFVCKSIYLFVCLLFSFRECFCLFHCQFLFCLYTFMSLYVCLSLSLFHCWTHQKCNIKVHTLYLKTLVFQLHLWFCQILQKTSFIIFAN